MSAPTPGPWHVAGCRENPKHHIESGAACVAVRTATGYRVEESLPNLRLMAASPELHAELAAIATELAAEVGDSHPSVVRARAVLAKAVVGG